MKKQLALFVTFLVSLHLIGASSWAIDPTAVPISPLRTITSDPLRSLVPDPQPDLIVFSVSNPPTAIVPGQSISVFDTTRNIGTAVVPSNTYTYYALSADLAIGNDWALVERIVPAGLAANADSTGSMAPQIPINIPSGSYYLMACADISNQVQESNEGNNCRFSTTTTSVGRPKLIVASVSTPQTSVSPGGKFMITDTTRNIGTGPTLIPERIHYAFSRDVSGTSLTPALGNREVYAGLAAGADSTGTVQVTIDPKMQIGSYYLIAWPWSDRAGQLVFSTMISVTWPDLLVTALSNPPNRARRGDTFQVTDTTSNSGTVPTGLQTSTAYYLSLDGVKDASDLVIGGRPVEVLAAGANSAAATVVTVPATAQRGKYWMLGCTDSGGVQQELNEGNNCRVSATQVTVQ